jgi:hypothetical protein
VGTAFVRGLRVLGNLLQKAGPYLLLEILLPGGTLLALLLFLHQRRRQFGTGDALGLSAVFARAVGQVRRQMANAVQLEVIASLWRGNHRERDGLEALALLPPERHRAFR